MSKTNNSNEVAGSNEAAESLVGPTHEPQVIDPNDPLHDSVEAILAGLSPAERAKRLREMFSPKEENPTKREGCASRAGRKSPASGLRLPTVFKAGTEFAEVNGVPVTFRPGDEFPFRWNEAEPVPFSIMLLLSDGVPLKEAEFRERFASLNATE